MRRRKGTVFSPNIISNSQIIISAFWLTYGRVRKNSKPNAGRAMKNAAKIGAKVKAATIMIAVMPKALSMVSKVNLQQQSN